MTLIAAVDFESLSDDGESVALTQSGMASNDVLDQGAPYRRTGLGTFSPGYYVGVTSSTNFNIGSDVNGSRCIAFAFYLASMTTNDGAERRIAGGNGTLGNVANLRLTPTGRLRAYVSNTLICESEVLLGTGWRWINWFPNGIVAGAASSALMVDSVLCATVGTGVSKWDNTMGELDTAGDYPFFLIDDLIVDDGTNGGNPNVIPDSRVNTLWPISDNSVGAGWTLGTGTAISSNGYAAVDNRPPLGVADLAAGSDTKQIRNAGQNTNAIAFNMDTYSSLGITSDDLVLSVQILGLTGAPSATSPKSGSFTLSNPTIAKTTFGNFYGTAVAGTFPTGWNRRTSAIQTNPSVTLGTNPVLTITQDTSSTRIAMVCGVRLVVAWRPRHPQPRPNVFMRAVQRSAHY